MVYSNATAPVQSADIVYLFITDINTRRVLLLDNVASINYFMNERTFYLKHNDSRTKITFVKFKIKVCSCF